MPDDESLHPTQNDTLSEERFLQLFKRETQSLSFSGPIPPPSILREYQEMVPDAPERIISMAEIQMKHRHELEAKHLDGSIRAEFRGQIFAFILAICVFILAFIMEVNGESLWSLALTLTALFCLAGIFIIGKQITSRERIAKTQRVQSLLNRAQHNPEVVPEPESDGKT